ncbi:MAG: class I SAM-dependent methyltransferase [Candidatus Kapaibacteriales bacterium]
MITSKTAKDLSLTAIIPLWSRALESSESKNPLFRDEVAEKVWNESEFLKSKKQFIVEADKLTKKFTQIEIAIRTHIIDRLVKDIHQENKEAIFLNTGSGLCTRSSRLGLRENFIESDTSEGLSLRGHTLGLSSSENCLTIDLNKQFPIGFIREKTGNKPLNIICEGTLMYFKKERALTLMKDLCKLAGAGGRVIVEVLGKRGEGVTHPMIKQINPELNYKWGVDKPKTLESEEVTLVSHHNVWKGYEEKWGPVSHIVKWWPGGRYSIGSFIAVCSGID